MASTPLGGDERSEITMGEKADPLAGERMVKIEIESCIKDEAETAVVAGRKRLMGEGGMEISCGEQMDARGLLLLIACFGVPSNFRSMDMLDLIQTSGSNEIAGALRRSPFLVPIISGSFYGGHGILVLKFH